MLNKINKSQDANKSKKAILKIILENPGPLKEKLIREKLIASESISERRNINRQLNQLKSYNCVEFYPPEKKGGANKWDITNFSTISKIMERYPDIEINKYNKILDILFLKYSIDLCKVESIILYASSSLSKSLFNLIKNGGIDNIKSKLWNVYIYDEIKNEEKLKENKRFFYEKYVQEETKMSMDEYNSLMNSFLSSRENIYDTWIKYFHFLEKELSIKTYFEIYNKIDNNLIEQRRDYLLECHLKNGYQPYSISHIKELIKLNADILRRNLFLEEIIKQHPDYEKKIQPIILQYKMYRVLYNIISLDIILKSKFNNIWYSYLLEICYKQDLLYGLDTKIERKYFTKFKQNKLKEKNFIYRDYSIWQKENVKILSELFIETSLALPNGNVYNNIKQIFSALEEIFGKSYIRTIHLYDYIEICDIDKI